MDRALFLACSQRKKPHDSLMPAIERYDGPLFRVLRRHVREGQSNPPFVWVLSSEYGLITADTPLPSYNRVMTRERAADLRASLPEAFRNGIRERPFAQVFVSLAGAYTDAMEDCWQYVPEHVPIHFADGGIGGRASQLSTWLSSGANEKVKAAPVATGKSSLLGVIIESSRASVLKSALQALRSDPSGASRFQTWFVDIDGTRVAPKWLVAQITGLSVSQFRTADARRVLTDLGLRVLRVTT